ncbi:MAG: TIGR03618 family F420-dependent PPOX class oxidoreductase [Acidimicrobiales bacterium]
MTEPELAEFLEVSRTVHVATVNADGTPHLVPLWFALDHGEIVFHTFARSRKIVNLRRDPRLTCLVEAGETYPELRGAQISGVAELITDVSEVERHVIATMVRYDPSVAPEDAAARAPAVAAKRVAVRVGVTAVASWDHRKLA